MQIRQGQVLDENRQLDVAVKLAHFGEHGVSRGVDDDAYVFEYDEEVLRSLDNDFP